MPRHGVSANEWEKMPSERVGVVQMEVGGGGLAEVLRECSASVRGLGYFLSYN